MNPIVDAGGYADFSLRIQLTGNGDADLQPETRPNTDAYQISAFLAKERSLASPTITKRVCNEIFLISRLKIIASWLTDQGFLICLLNLQPPGLICEWGLYCGRDVFGLNTKIFLEPSI